MSAIPSIYRRDTIESTLAILRASAEDMANPQAPFDISPTYLAGYLAAVRAFEVALELTPAREMHHDNEEASG